MYIPPHFAESRPEHALLGKSKLSQNKETRDRAGAADALQARGHAELGRLMRPGS